MVTKIGNYEIVLDEDNYFEDDLLMYNQFSIKHDGKTEVIGVTCDDDEKYENDEFDTMRNLFAQLKTWKEKPLVALLSEPLRTIVKEQDMSTYGMYFYENDEDFPFTKEDLDALDKQIEKYHLEYIIEVNPDAEPLNEIITCYMSLCTYFNFLPPDLISERLCDVVQKFLKDKGVDFDLAGLSFIPIINAWNYKEIEASKAEFFGQLIDCVEDFLEEKEISIPSEDRGLAIAAGEDPEGLALVYGEDYDYLADAFAEILHITR